MEGEARAWRLLGRAGELVKCRKRGPPLRGRPTVDRKTCRTRIPQMPEQWRPVCRWLADVDAAVKG